MHAAAALIALLGPEAYALDAPPPPPVRVAAARAVNAQQAAMLGSDRAGARLVAVGEHGIVLLSDDDGRSHRQARSVPIDATLTSVSFVDSRRGWAAGHWGAVLHTDDGGENWSLQRTDVQHDRPLFGVHFFDASHGVAVGLWSLVILTEDGGRTWQEVTMPVPDGAKKADLNLFGLFADERGRLFAAAERGMVLRSDDRGRHWTYLPTDYKGSFWTGLVAPDGALLAAGLRGSLYRSADDGRTWTRIETGTKSSITSIARAGADIVAVGLDGLEMRSRDSGKSFTTQQRGDSTSLTSVAVNTKGMPVLYSRQGVVDTTIAPK